MAKHLIILLLSILPLSIATAQGWERLYGTTRTDNPTGLTATNDGGYLLCGFTIEATTPKHDILLIKTDADGQQQWTRTIGKRNVYERAYSVIQNPDGTYIIVGVSVRDSTDTDGRIFIAKLTSRGDTLWTKMPSPPNFCNDVAYDVRRLRDGSGYIVGGVACRQGLDNRDDISITKIDNAGNTVFQKTFGDDQHFEFTRKVVETADGGFMVSGVSGLYGVDSQRVLIVRFDRNGNALWSKSFGERSFNDCTDILADTEGGAWVTGVVSLDSGQFLTFLKKFSATGVETWSKTYPDLLYAYQISRTQNGGFQLVSGNFGGQRLREWVQTDSLGNLLVRRKIYSYNPTDELTFAVPTKDNGLAMLGGRTVNGNRDFHLLKLDAAGAFSANTISGKIYNDQNANCQFDATDKPLADWLVKAESGDKVFWGFTDSLGFYQIGIDSSNYQVSLVKPNRYWLPCRDSVFVGLNSSFPRATFDFAVKPNTSCPLLEVDVTTPLLRRCYENSYFVRYCNKGTTTARGASVRIVLDKYLTFNSASIPLSSRRGDTLFFNVPNLETNTCGTFSFRATVRCDSTYLGQTHCVEAHIYPDSICVPTPGWSGASIEVSGNCLRDSVLFLIKNVGSGTTSQPIKQTIVIDDITYLNSIVPTLAPGGIQAVKYPATGQTYRLIADQEVNHPSVQRTVTATVEGCRATPLTPLSIGYVTQFPEDDGDPFVSIDCHENQGSFDPNDKLGLPKGIGNQHFIDEGTEINYLIRFQNTGTDTAFTVVVRDTLSAFLDPTTVHLGASSHNVDFDIVEGKILKFSFKNILLVDSFRNAAASQGFVKFLVKLKKDIPFGSKIENQAAIYFDFNKPILTNKTFHTLRKPERYNGRTIPLCDNTPYNGRLYTTDTRLYDTLRFAKFDSIVINWLQIKPTFKTSIDTVVKKGLPFKGVVYQRDTTIAVKFAARNTCDSIVTYKLKIITGTQDFANGDIKIYPNPFTQQTTIELPPQYQGNFELKIYDATGKYIESRTVSDNKFIFNKELLTQGMYFFSIYNKEKPMAFGKLIITQ
jgi:uncharacterized repeat protein (TIGR01451 family)